MELLDYIKAGSAVIGLLMAIWTFLTRLHRSMLRHFSHELRDTFANKQDFHRLETKLDALVSRAWNNSRNSRQDHS